MKPRALALLVLGLALGVLFGAYLCWVAPPIPADAQGVGIFGTSATGTRTNCTQVTSPVVGQTICFDQADNTWKSYTGSSVTATNWAASVATYTGVNLARDFGMKCDGTTDDTAAFQRAIDAGSGGTVQLPSGTCQVTATLTITNGVRIVGAGAGPGGVLAPGLSTAYRGTVIEHNFVGDLFQVTGVKGLVEPSVGTTFENLLLRQVNGNGTGASGRAIFAVGGSDTFKPSWIRIHRVTTETGTGKNDWSWGFYGDGSATSGFLNGGIRDTWITDSRFNSGTNGTGEIFCESCANLFVSNVELNGTATNVQLTGADAAHATTGAFISNVNTNGALVLTRATNVLAVGGSWTSVSMTANCSNCLLFPNVITNTPTAPAAPNNVIRAFIGGLGKHTTITNSGDSVEYRTNGIGLRNGTAAFVGTLDAQQLSFLTSGATNVFIDSTGIMTAGLGINITGGAFAAGRISRTGTAGLAIAGVAGSPSDLVLFSAAGIPALSNPTGTSGIQIQNSGLQLGSPTGGDKGAGTVNAAAGLWVNGTQTIWNGSLTNTPLCTNNCGLAPTIAGTNTAMRVTMGATGVPATPFLVLFNGTWNAAPACIAQIDTPGTTAATVTRANATTTGVLINTVVNPPTNAVYSIHCLGVG